MNAPRLISFLLAILSATLGAISVNAETPLRDFEAEAKALCDSLPLDGIEGIWSIPGEDNLLLLIRRDNSSSSVTYKLTCVRTGDISIAPGTLLGTLSPTVSKNTFRLSMLKHPESPAHKGTTAFVAKISPDATALEFSKRDASVSVNPLAMIPYLRRILRFNINDPMRKIPKGYVKIYPRLPHSGEITYF